MLPPVQREEMLTDKTVAEVAVSVAVAVAAGAAVEVDVADAGTWEAAAEVVATVPAPRAQCR